MKLRLIKPMAKQGFVGVWRNRLMSLASIGSVAASLIILGIILITVLNINNITNIAKEEFDEIHMYLKDDLSVEEIKNVEEKLNELDGVLSVLYQSKDQALEYMKEEWGEEGELLDGLEENPLPNTFIVQFKDIKYTKNITEKLKSIDGIEDVKLNTEVVDKLIGINKFIRTTGIIIISILIFMSIFIISNTIRITVAARKREINIMKYVGSTNGFIRGPFILEGIILGLVGSGIAALIINYGYKYVFTMISEKLYVIMTIYMIPPYSINNDVLLLFISIGVGIGILGSVFSLRKYLRV